MIEKNASTQNARLAFFNAGFTVLIELIRYLCVINRNNSIDDVLKVKSCITFIYARLLNYDELLHI